MALLALVTSSHPPPQVIVTLMVLPDLRRIDLYASLGVAGGNNVLTAEELLFSVDDTDTSLPGLATEVTELSTARAG